MKALKTVLLLLISLNCFGQNTFNWYACCSPKEYIAMIKQDTANVQMTVLKNTIGTITWVENSVGQYEGNCTGCFTLGKTSLDISVSGEPYFVGGTNGYVYYRLNPISADQIKILATDLSGTFADKVISDRTLTIKVYP